MSNDLRTNNAANNDAKLQLVLAFFTPDMKESGNLFSGLANRFVARYTRINGEDQRFSHVELVFTEKTVGSSALIVENNKVTKNETSKEKKRQRKPTVFVVQWPYVPWSYSLRYCLIKPLSCIIRSVSNGCFCSFASDDVYDSQKDEKGKYYLADGDKTEDQRSVDRKNEKNTSDILLEEEKEIELIALNVDPDSAANELEVPISNMAVRLEIWKDYKQKKGYGFIGLTVGEDVYEKIFLEAARYASDVKTFKFNYWGQFFNFLPNWTRHLFSPFVSIPISGGENGGFCSEVITLILQKHLGILTELKAETISPNHLYFWLNEESKKKGSIVPYVLMAEDIRVGTDGNAL
jgi:hypothetical protein